MMVQRPTCTGQTLDEVTKLARLELTDERKAAVGPAIDMINGLVDQLDAITLGDVPPATGYDARWE